MKKLTSILALLLCAAAYTTPAQTEKTNSPAQYTSIGPVLGFADSWVGNMGGKTGFMPSGNFGIGITYARNEHWGWGGQLLFASQGYRNTYGGNTAMVTPLYLRMPLRGYYFFNGYKDRIRPKLFLGPELGVKLAEYDDLEIMTGEGAMAMNTGTYRTLDLGISGGAGVNILIQKGTWFNFDLGYYQGLTDVIKDRAGSYNVNHGIGLSAGVLFGIK